MSGQKRNQPPNSPSTLLAFDSSYKLIAIFRSVSEAAAMTGLLRQSIVKAAYGEIISVGKKYWRVVPPDLQIEPDDIGALSLFDFDAEMGIDRKIYATRKMLKGSVMFESEYASLGYMKRKQNK